MSLTNSERSLLIHLGLSEDAEDEKITELLNDSVKGRSAILVRYSHLSRMLYFSELIRFGPTKKFLLFL